MIYVAGYISPETVIAQWLKEISLESYAHKFIENGFYDFKVIDTFQDCDLEAMGISDSEHRSKILAHIKQRTNPKAEEGFIVYLFLFDMKNLPFHCTYVH